MLTLLTMTQRLARTFVISAMGFLCFHLGDDIGRLFERGFRNRDELAWIAGSFHVGEARMAEVRRLHNEFLAGHRQTIVWIERDSTEFAQELDRVGRLTPELAAKLEKLEQRRSRSHAEVLEHCLRIRTVLEGEAGERYLHEMERVLLGLQARHHLATTGSTPPREIAND